MVHNSPRYSVPVKPHMCFVQRAIIVLRGPFFNCGRLGWSSPIFSEGVEESLTPLPTRPCCRAHRGRILHLLAHTYPVKVLHGPPADEPVTARARSFLRAAHTYKSLGGCRFGMFGGYSMGINTAAINPNRWLRLFGIDSEWNGVRRMQ